MGDVLYFWACLEMGDGVSGSSDVLTFWSMCDMLNGGNCRKAFELAFRKISDLLPHIEALPPMPEDGGYWSTLHSWVMPTPSFLEFMMFTRMFADSLDSFYLNSSAVTDCLLGSTKDEKRHCYCRILELLVTFGLTIAREIWFTYTCIAVYWPSSILCILEEDLCDRNTSTSPY